MARVVAAVTSNCVDDLGGKLDAVSAEKPLKAKFLSYNPATQPPWNSFLTANSVSRLPPGVPVFIAQGKADEIVRKDVTQQFVQTQCAAGIRSQIPDSGWHEPRHNRKSQQQPRGRMDQRPLCRKIRAVILPVGMSFHTSLAFNQPFHQQRHVLSR